MSSFDDLKIYGSGAASDGGAQAVESANLGNYRSSTELGSLAILGAMERITINRLSSGHTPGVAAIESDGSSKLRYTAPESNEPGQFTTVGDGSTVVLVDGQDSSKGIKVTRSGAIPAAGARQLKFLDVYNNPFGMDNVSNAERVAGDDEYRCIFLKNSSAAAIDLRIFLQSLGTARTVNAAGYAASGGITLPVNGSIEFWPLSGFVENEDTGEVLYYSSRSLLSPWTLTVPAAGRDVYAEVGGGAAGVSGQDLVPIPGLRIAREDPSSQPSGPVQTIANENSAPTGRTWLHPNLETDLAVLIIPALAAGNIVGLWIHRKIVAGATARAHVQNFLNVEHFAAS